MSLQVMIKLIPSKDGKLPEKPEYATAGSAAADLRAFLDVPMTIGPGESVLVPTGIAIELPGNGYAAFVYARSGLAAKYGISLANGVGVIDSDYRGEIKVPMINFSKNAYTVSSGDRIAQLVIMPVARMESVILNELSESGRGDGGFGSTGR